jgi:hypothetical protein
MWLLLLVVVFYNTRYVNMFRLSVSNIRRSVVVETFCRLNNQLKAMSKSKTIIRSPSGPLFLSSIEELLREKFSKTMISNNTQIFSSWSNFERSLPRNDLKWISSYWPLYTLEYYSLDDDLQNLADEIMQPPENSEKQIRTCVMYIAAPPSYGKSSCILPAFLKTNYLIIFTLHWTTIRRTTTDCCIRSLLW